MKVHANAALGPKGRLTMVGRVVEHGWSVTEAAAAAGVSNRTCRKRVDRSLRGADVMPRNPLQSLCHVCVAVLGARMRSREPHRSPLLFAKENPLNARDWPQTQACARVRSEELRAANRLGSR